MRFFFVLLLIGCKTGERANNRALQSQSPYYFRQSLENGFNARDNIYYGIMEQEESEVARLLQCAKKLFKSHTLETKREQKMF